MLLKEKFKELESDNSALLATNFYNFETALGVTKAAAAQQAPLILQATQSSIQYMGLDMTVAIARTAIKQAGIQAWLHLDHAHSYELIATCLDAGFDSVMIDASEKSYKENVALTCKVVKLAQSYNANVEAELGYVAKLGQEQMGGGFTTPEQAKEFVEVTGINALAVAIGSAHGFYEKEPNLKLDLLSDIHAAVDIALVLHGGSGIPGDQVKEGIRRGIRKINVATETKNMFMLSLKKELQNNQEIDLRKVFPVAINNVAELIQGKLALITDA